jgi:DNA-directed RNA polymerase subunit RPC12/RpoP
MTVQIECASCKKKFSKKINEDALGTPIEQDPSREMGDELGYELEQRGECPHCNHIYSKITLYFYPTDVFNFGYTN